MVSLLQVETAQFWKWVSKTWGSELAVGLHPGHSGFNIILILMHFVCIFRSSLGSWEEPIRWSVDLESSVLFNWNSSWLRKLKINIFKSLYHLSILPIFIYIGRGLQDPHWSHSPRWPQLSLQETFSVLQPNTSKVNTATFSSPDVHYFS